MRDFSAREHWDEIYRTRASTKRSWYRDHLDVSLDLIADSHLPLDAAIVDIGGGSSTLVDDLLDRGYTNVRVLDISGEALAEARRRLGSRARDVVWLEEDVRTMNIDHGIDLWHDRAVFHFLTQEADRDAYGRSMLKSVKPKGFAVLATFAPDGPEKCSGLSVMRYSDRELAERFSAFRLLQSRREMHVTPSGDVQAFTYVFLQKDY